ncbi:unnamed protein product [Auanema sp. JU1783]|nr:unnamed protein product [Auanema sp. JU1783]
MSSVIQVKSRSNSKERRQSDKTSLEDDETQCPFAIHFCPVKGSTERIKRHLRDDRTLHLVLLCKSICHLRNVRDILLIQNMNNLEFLENKIATATCVFNRFNSQHIFHVSQVEKHIKNCLKSLEFKEIIGQPFESHRFGYKLVPIIAPYADKDTEQEYLSVSIALIRGDYDAILKWPFQFPIKFTIVGANKMFEKHVSPRFPDDEPRLKRPLRERNSAFGIKNFLLLNEIEQFTVHNDLFIKITVEITSESC